MPEGYRVRGARPDDFEPVVELVRAYDVATRGVASAAADRLRAIWDLPVVGLERSIRIVVAPGGELAAYAICYSQHPEESVDGWARVHPDHMGVGLGGALLGWIDRRAGELVPPQGGPPIRTSIPAEDVAARELLLSRGRVHVRTFWEMERDLTDLPPIPTPEQGVTIRGFRPADARDVHRALEDAFRKHYGFEAWSFEEWEQTVLRGPGFDAELSFVAIGGERMVGAVLGEDVRGHAWIGELGVTEPARGTGTGSALLVIAWHALARRGHEHVGLHVDTDPDAGALRFYERLGMSARWEVQVFESPAGRAAED
jgi:mycothiol synthase